MKLRIKIFLIISSVLGILFFGMSVLLSNNLSREFSKLEKDDAQKNISRLEDVFRERTDELYVKLVDWSQWDDMNTFVEDQNEEFIISNFPKETLTNLRINFAVVLSKERTVVYEKFVGDDGEEADFPVGLEKYFAPGSPFVTFDGSSDSNKGTLMFPDKRPVIAAARPITSSDGTSPENGAVIFGYYFDETSAQDLSRLTHTNVDFSLYGTDGLADDFSEARQRLTSENPFFVENPTNSENMISGYSLVKDVFNEPAFILRAGSERSIYNKGLETKRLFLEIMLGIGVLFISIVLFLFEFLVLRKISQLSNEVRKISAGENQSSSLDVRGKDEFGQLGRDINKMLEMLRIIDEHKKEYIREIERMNSMMVSRELRMVELKKEIKKLKNDEEAGNS